MRKNRLGLAAFILLPASVPAEAGNLDVLQGKFAFDWHGNLGRQKCVKVDARLLAEFDSPKYRCDLKPVSNTSTGAGARICSQGEDKKEYLIFDTLRACEKERKAQESNE